MIDAKDLRIGNWILVDDNKVLPYYHEIMAKDIFDIAEGIIPLKAIHIEPITLTPDILIRFGFEVANDTNDYFGGWLVSLKNGNKMRVIFDGVKYYHDAGFIYADCDVVHQLQNLYYALTGEELIFKP